MDQNRTLTALAGVAQLVRAPSCNQRVVSLIPGWGACWVVHWLPVQARMVLSPGTDGKQPIQVSLTSAFFSLPSSLSKAMKKYPQVKSKKQDSNDPETLHDLACAPCFSVLVSWAISTALPFCHMGLGILHSFPQNSLPFPTHAAAPSCFTFH